ncbi:unnamed protein product [Owenia fusiformis]|uniref:Uncharacterized protein n=1 Tax=Owenia fusiformis TaxID=6347 RepID=A0A8J1UQV9_OWEFU|nr:unnamed protein product [Owenia fusiformis]
MPLVKKGKTKSEKASGDVTLDAAGNILDPTSVLEGGATDTKKKPKKKKKKMTKGEKEAARLEKAAEVLRTSGDKYMQFVDTVDRWVVKNGTKAIQLFRRFDSDGDGFLSYDEFKSGMFDINAPLNAIELHLLCKLLDKDSNNAIMLIISGMFDINAPLNAIELHLLCKLLDKDSNNAIDYREFNAGLTFVREGDDSHFPNGNREDGFLVTTQRQFEHCVCCKMALWHPYKDPYPKYLDVSFKLATFENAKSHPGHFKSKVSPQSPCMDCWRSSETMFKWLRQNLPCLRIKIVQRRLCSQNTKHWMI